MSNNQDVPPFSADGRARMVDVSQKDSTQRTVVASGILRMQSATLTRIHAGRIAKGNLLAVADLAAVVAAKETSLPITMCRSLALNGAEMAFLDVRQSGAAGCVGIKVGTTVRYVDQAGVEIEFQRRACAKPPRCRLEDGPIAIVTDMDEIYPHLPHFSLDEMTGLAGFILSPRPR